MDKASLEFEPDIDVAFDLSVNVSELEIDPCVAKALELCGGLIAPAAPSLLLPVVLAPMAVATGLAECTAFTSV